MKKIIILLTLIPNMMLKASTFGENDNKINQYGVLNNSSFRTQYNQNNEPLTLFNINTNSYSLNKQIHDSTSFERYIQIKYTIGLGLGLNYGGIGFNVSKYIGSHASAWCGLGSNLLRVGLSTGIKLHALSTDYRSLINFYGLIMYGYHGIIQVSNRYFAETKIKTYYGFSLGGGLDLFQSKYGIISTGVIIPIYSQNFINDHKNGNYQSLLFSIGYLFTFQN